MCSNSSLQKYSFLLPVHLSEEGRVAEMHHVWSCGLYNQNREMNVCVLYT